jgi:predicted amidophosphoribosyltransferase
VGDAGRLRPRRSVCDEEAQLTPLGKRAPWSGNQLTHTVKKQCLRNQPSLKNLLVWTCYNVVIEKYFRSLEYVKGFGKAIKK